MGGETLIRRFRSQLAGFYFLRYMLHCLAFSAFLGGIVILAVRGFSGRNLPEEGILSVGLVVVCLAVIYSLIRTVCDIPSIDRLRAVFDKVNCCGGLLMTSSEGSIGAWMDRISSVQRPRIIWRGRRLGVIFISAMFFMAISLMVPQRYMASVPAGRLEIRQQTGQLDQQVRVLEEEAIIPEETARDLRRQIELIEETASGRDPVKTWEAMGLLQDQLKKAAEEASIGMLAETETLTQTETLAEALHKIGSGMEAQAREGAVFELSRAAQLQIAQNPSLQQMFDGQLRDALETGQLTDEQIRQLMEALKGRKLELAECMGKLCQADLTDLKFVTLCESKGQCNAEGLMALLSQCQGCEGGKEAAALFMNTPGWGINRGRGDAPMVWSDPSDRYGAVFQEQALPPAAMAAMKDSELVGVSLSAPSLEEGDGHLQHGRLSSGQAGSGQAVKQILLPKHKAAVKAYFDHDTDTEQ